MFTHITKEKSNILLRITFVEKLIGSFHTNWNHDMLYDLYLLLLSMTVNQKIGCN